MKNTLLGFLLFTAISTNGQNGTTGSTKPVSNSDLPTNTSQSNNSNSGVNPAGNPGTIINSTTSSNSANQGLIQPVGVPPAPAYYNLPADTFPLRTRISTADNRMELNADTMSVQAYVPGDSILPEPVMTPADAPIIADTQNIVTSGVAPQGNVSSTGMGSTVTAPTGYSETIMIGLSRYASLPVLSTWVPENIVSQLSSRFSNGLYDITMVKSSADEMKHHYIIRSQDNGVFTTHVITDLE